MSYETPAPRGLNYYPCRYGRSRVVFRGPRRRLAGKYCAFLGGAATYGAFVRRPFPALVEAQLKLPCINLGVVNAGPDLFAQDPDILRAAQDARVVVVEAFGAQNMSNRYYAVHPRRNDRFLRASAPLMTLYPEVDFTEFNFTRHMLGALNAKDSERFGLVVQELQAAWVARMKSLLRSVGQPVVLLWLSRHVPSTKDAFGEDTDPLFVTRSMLTALRSAAQTTVEATISAKALGRGTRGMVFAEFEQQSAERQFGPLAHEETAQRLLEKLEPLLLKGDLNSNQKKGGL